MGNVPIISKKSERMTPTCDGAPGHASSLTPPPSPPQVHGEFAKKLEEEQDKNAASQKTARNSMRKKERRQKGLGQVRPLHHKLPAKYKKWLKE